MTQEVTQEVMPGAFPCWGRRAQDSVGTGQEPSPTSSSAVAVGYVLEKPWESTNSNGQSLPCPAIVPWP